MHINTEFAATAYKHTSTNKAFVFTANVEVLDAPVELCSFDVCLICRIGCAEKKEIGRDLLVDKHLDDVPRHELVPVALVPLSVVESQHTPSVHHLVAFVPFEIVVPVCTKRKSCEVVHQHQGAFAPMTMCVQGAHP